MPTPRKYPALHDPDYLFERYIVDGLTHYELAMEIGCTPSAVQSALGKLELPPMTRRKGGRRFPVRKDTDRKAVEAIA